MTSAARRAASALGIGPGSELRRLEGPLARFDATHDVFDHDHGVVDDEADRDHISDTLSMVSPARYITAQVASSDTGIVTLGMRGARSGAVDSRGGQSRRLTLMSSVKHRGHD
jgi:hypothetical protein